MKIVTIYFEHRTLVFPLTGHEKDVISGITPRIVQLVPRVGFEPTTYGLELHCSIQLSYRGAKVDVVRDGGIEPPALAWKASVLAVIQIPRTTEVIISYVLQSQHETTD